MTMISNLPGDLIEDILSRVPVTSLRRLRSTCKLWYHHALFKDPVFIQKHVHKTKRAKRQSYDVLLLESKLYSVRFNLNGIHNNSFLVYKTRHNLVHTNGISEVNISQVFHCDGIFLCTTKEYGCVVWNPFSGKSILIEPINRHHNIFDVYALGYNNKELFYSYKILRFTYYEKLEIYEFISNSWRNLDVSPQCDLLSRGVSLKGNTYWVSKRRGVKEYSLLCFDFSTERFQNLCVPFHQEAEQADAMALSVVREEHISLLYQNSKTLKMEIWMTSEIETRFVSWCKFLTVDLSPYSFVFSNPISFYIDEEKKVAVCFKKEDTSNKIYIVGEDKYDDLSICYTTSLVNDCWPTVFTYVPRLD